MFNYAPIPRQNPRGAHAMTRSRPREDFTWPHLVARRRFGTLAAGFAAVIVFSCLGGCRSANEAASGKPAPPPSQQQASEIRQQLMAEDPNALVGEVVEVLPESQMAAVGDVDVNRFKVHDTLVFIDAAKQPQSTGEVLRIVNGQLHVRYEPLHKGKRAPRNGDLAVRAQ